MNPLHEQALGNITPYHRNDVLCGRGRFIREHSGNKQFISFIKELKHEYVAAEVTRKRYLADLVVRRIRTMEPPGRFLKRCDKTKKWVEIGDRQAVIKARQALREGAPKVMRQILSSNKVEGVENKRVFVDERAPRCTCNKEKCRLIVETPKMGLNINGRFPPSPHTAPSPNCTDYVDQSIVATAEQIQPIPLYELPTITITTSRDDANNLLRILESPPESSCHSSLEDIQSILRASSFPSSMIESEAIIYGNEEGEDHLGELSSCSATLSCKIESAKSQPCFIRNAKGNRSYLGQSQSHHTSKRIEIHPRHMNLDLSQESCHNGYREGDVSIISKIKNPDVPHATNIKIPKSSSPITDTHHDENDQLN